MLFVKVMRGGICQPSFASYFLLLVTFLSTKTEMKFLPTLH